jgi:hypothetical protein
MSKTKPKLDAHICWFEIPADDVKRAQQFYSKLFGWKISPIPGMTDYWHIDTGSPDARPDGGLMKRKQPEQQITNYVMVPSVTKHMAKIKKLGGDVCVPKTAVPGMGFFAVCKDPENNTFALWEIAPQKPAPKKK